MPVNEILQFAPEDRVMCIDVTIIDDELMEPTEVFEVVLELDPPVMGVSLIPSLVSVEIIDDDSGKCSVLSSYNM